MISTPISFESPEFSTKLVEVPVKWRLNGVDIQGKAHNWMKGVQGKARVKITIKCLILVWDVGKSTKELKEVFDLIFYYCRIRAVFKHVLRAELTEAV